MGRNKKILHPPIESVYESITTKWSQSFDTIFYRYIKCCETESDINELLPEIYKVALQCGHCTEFGVRIPTSTYAFLAAKPDRLVSYDIGRYPEVDEVEKLCLEEGQNFEFILASVLEVEIEETDFLFTDTYHDYAQLKAELAKHSDKVRKFIGIHDWATYKNRGEAWYPGVADFMHTGEGLERAVKEFLTDNPTWSIYFETENNNGLLILKRN